MGADIHWYIETKKSSSEPWTLDDFHTVELIKEEGEEPYNEISDKYAQYGYGDRNHYGDRNYTMFGILANVRCKGAIYEPRGVPNDLSKALAEEVDRWDGDGHSHSYLSLDEFKECLDIYKTSGIKGDNSYTSIYELAANWLAREQAEAMLLETGFDPQIRFVFFFDN